MNTRKKYTISLHKQDENTHFDLFLEMGTCLATWRIFYPPTYVGGSPSQNPAMFGANAPILATKLPDHRVEYLDYEGEISGGRGTVSICETGTYQLTDCDNLVAGIAAGKFSVHLTATLRSETVSVTLVQFTEMVDRTWTLEFYLSSPMSSPFQSLENSVA